MNYGAEPADQVVRYTLEGTEFALKISGTAAKNFAVFALAVLRDQKKTHGKTKLVRLLREGKPLKFFSVPTDQMRDFAKAAKSHGLLYVPIRDRSDPDNIEIAVWAEDAAKVNRVIDKLQLDVVDPAAFSRRLFWFSCRDAVSAFMSSSSRSENPADGSACRRTSWYSAKEGIFSCFA